MGEDVSDMATTTSQLQAKLLALTGGKVDIMLDENTFKSSTQILREMSEAWESMTDIQKASALELMGGKRQANVLSALIQNFDTAEKAIEASAKSSGSALRENEVWLDSISGKISQFNNALQSMWSNTLDSDVVKGFVSLGTELVKIIDSLGIVKTLVIGIGTYIIQKNFKGDLWGGIFNASSLGDAKNHLKSLKTEYAKAQKAYDANHTDANKKYLDKTKKKYDKYDAKVSPAVKEYDELTEKLSKLKEQRQSLVDDISNSQAHEDFLGARMAAGYDGAAEAIDKAHANTEKLKGQMSSVDQQIINTENALKNVELQAKKSGVAGATAGQKIKTAFVSGTKAVGTFIKQVATSMLTMYAIITALDLFGKLWTGLNEWGSGINESSEEAQEKFEELNSELSTAQSELHNLESELDKTNDRMDELMSMGTLSFVEQEELNNLRKQSSELEHQITLAKTLEETLQNVVNLAAINASQKTFSQTSFYSEESKKERAEEAKETGSAWGSAAGMALGLAISFIPGVNIGALALMGGGALAGNLLGGVWGQSSENAEYDSEKSVTAVLNNMAAERAKLEKTRDEAYAAYVEDPENENLTKQWEEAQSALGTYDATLAQHISQMQQYVNSIDPKTLTDPADKAYYEQMKKWVDTYSVMMGGGEAKSSVIGSLFGENASDELKDIQSRIESAVKAGENITFIDFEDEKYDSFKEMLSDYGLTITNIIGYFKSLNAEESAAFDYDTYDTVKEIAKLEDGFSSLKDAFDEFNESGIVTAQTLIKLNEVFGNVEGWQKYVDVMSTGTASTEEATKVTRDLAEALMHNVLLNPFDFTNDDGTKNLDAFTSYLTAIQQLRSIGVTNAKELVDAKQQEAMVNQVVSNIKRVQELESKATLTEAEQTELTKLKKNNYAEYAKVVEDAYGVQIKNTQLIEQQLELSKTQTELSKYNEFYSKHFGVSDLDLSTYEDNAEKIGTLQKVVDGYNATISEYENQGFWNTLGDNIGAFFDSFFLNEDGSGIENDVTRYQDAVNSIGSYVSQIDEYKNNSKKIFDELVSFANENQISLDGIDINAFDATDVNDNSVFRQVYNVVEKYIGDKKIELGALEEDLKEKLNTSFDAIDLEVTLELLDKDKLIDDIQSVYDTLLGAQKEYADNGYLSVDTMQSLLQLEPKYLDMLVDENGNLNLNKSALQEVARARITDLSIKQQTAIYEQALALATNGSKDALLEYISTMETATEVGQTWHEQQLKLISDALAKKVLDKEITQTEANEFIAGIKNQIQAVQVVASAALNDLDNSLSSSGNTATSEMDDAFQKLMDYYDNRISANQAKYDQIQNDIDYLEKQGKMADANYYKDQIALLTEGKESKQELLKDKLQGAKDRLAELEAAGKKGSDEWWEAAKIHNDTMSELDDVRDTVLELQIAIGETKWETFEEFNSRLDDINSKLETMRDLIAPNGEEDWFSDTGEWTEKGVAVLGSQVQQLMQAKAGLDEANSKLEEFGVTQNDDGTWSAKGYAGNEAWYKENYGIQSEQQYTDWLKKLTDEQYKYASAVSDTEQDIADMYESSIDAAEEYYQTLIDGYNDYIDSVKEALDAERDLYDFKKNVQKQAKDIASLERRIASLSGSTNKSDIAERRKLEQQLMESKESLNDTYYDHSKQSQQDAIDSEAQAYEESMNRFIENLHTNLDLALQDMDTFIQGVTSAVTVNAPTILDTYNNLGIALDGAIVAPWQAAIDAMGDDGYSGEEGLGLMNSWVSDGGEFSRFASKASNYLTSVWDETNVDPDDAFYNAVNDQMGDIVENIRKNVETAKTYLSDLANVEDYSGRYNEGGDDPDDAGDPPPRQYRYTASIGTYEAKGGSFDSEKEAKEDAENKLLNKFQEAMRNDGVEDGFLSQKWAQYKHQFGSIRYAKYAKGTTGTTRDKLAIVDELGPELILHANPTTGRLEYLTKGSSVMTADATAELMKLADIGVDGLMMPKFDSGVNMMTNYITKPEFKIDIEEFVHVERVDQNTLPQLEKMMDKKIDDFSKALNYSIKRFAR